MPARKHREGQALANWQARKDQHAERMEIARLRVQSMSSHMLLRPIEVAAMLGVTPKTLREMEGRGDLPPRVTFSAKVFGWRLADMAALILGKTASPHRSSPYVELTYQWHDFRGAGQGAPACGAVAFHA